MGWDGRGGRKRPGTDGELLAISCPLPAWLSHIWGDRLSYGCMACTEVCGQDTCVGAGGGAVRGCCPPSVCCRRGHREDSGFSHALQSRDAWGCVMLNPHPCTGSFRLLLNLEVRVEADLVMCWGLPRRCWGQGSWGRLCLESMAPVKK